MQAMCKVQSLFKNHKKFAIAIASLSAIFIIVFYYGDNREAVVREWARLAPFPSSAQHLSITTTGSAFSREFNGSFTASPEDLKQWIEQSPGLSDAVQEHLSPMIVKYNIKPGGGASSAAVIINFNSGEVAIRTCWS